MNDRIQKILDILSEEFPEPKSELQYASVFQLLVAVILSAQCTDKRVNSVTPMLFEKAPDAFSMAALPVEDIENIIHSCGFYKNKAANIRKCSEILVSEYGGEVPGELDKLVRLPGVGNKTASVILAVGFNLPAFAVGRLPSLSAPSRQICLQGNFSAVQKLPSRRPVSISPHLISRLIIPI